MLHCCGGVRELLPGLIDAGLDAINPVQITCRGMEAAGLKRDFGSRLTFWGGGCDTRDVLIKGTPAQVREHVRQQVKHLAARRRLRLPAGPQHHGRRAARQHRGDVRRGAGLITSDGKHFLKYSGLPMNYWKPVVLCALVLGATQEARGQALVYEPFDYPVGQLLTGQTTTAGQGWINGGSGTDDAAIVPGGLTIPGLATPLGNCLTNGGAGPGNRILFNTALSSGTVYYSFALRVDKLGASFAGGTSFITSLGYEPVSTLIQQAQLFVRTNPAGAGGYVLGITKTDSSAILFSPQVFTNGQTLFIVVSYTFKAGSSTDDQVRLWISPDSLTFGATSPPPATVTATATGTDIAQIDRLNLRQNIASNIPEAMSFDELRVATNWAGVTPPASGNGPVLKIIPAGTTASLSWPVNRRGFVLETTTNLANAGSWQAATNNVTVAGSNFLVAAEGAGSSRFFRLRSPGSPGMTVESVHFGFNASYPGMTDALRLSARTGPNWWSLNTTRQNPEDSADIPYAYHDGYVEWIGAASAPTRTPAEAALRWYMILHEQGDPWTGATPATVGHPAIILLDEVTTNFKDTLQGPALQEALRIYLTQYGGSRDDIIAYLQRSASLTATPNLYSSLTYCANNYLRYLALEVYCSHQGFITGVDADGNNIGLTDDAYLATRMALPIKRWADAGTSPLRLLPVLALSNFAGYSGYAKPFQKFLNRQFWFLANGWYDAGHTAVDPNIKTALRNGMATYTWGPGTGVWQLDSAELSRDVYHEQYIRWYCVDGHLDAHPDGVDAR